MNGGDTFRRSVGSHLWVVISDPRRDPQRVVIVNMTTVRHNSDRSCLIQAGEHGFVRHETCIMYAFAKTVADVDLERQLAAGQIQLLAPVSSILLRRIRDGAVISDFTPLGIVQVLVDQGIVSDAE